MFGKGAEGSEGVEGGVEGDEVVKSVEVDDGVDSGVSEGFFGLEDQKENMVWRGGEAIDCGRWNGALLFGAYERNFGPSKCLAFHMIPAMH